MLSVQASSPVKDATETRSLCSAFAPHAARMSACRLLVKNPPNGAALEASILLVMAEMRKLIPNEEIISRIEKNIYSGVSCQSVQYISARSRGILRWFQEVQGVYNRPEIDGAAIITHRLSDPWIKRLKTMIFFNMQVHEDIYSEIVANVTA